MKRPILLLCVFLAFCVNTTSVNASEASHFALADKVSEQWWSDVYCSEIVRTIALRVAQDSVSVRIEALLTDEKRPHIDLVVSSVNEAMKEAVEDILALPDFRKMTAQLRRRWTVILMEAFTEDELKSLAEFGGSPVGRKFLKTTQNVEHLRAMQQAGEEFGRKLFEGHSGALGDKINEKLQNLVNEGKLPKKILKRMEL